MNRTKSPTEQEVKQLKMVSFMFPQDLMQRLIRVSISNGLTRVGGASRFNVLI